MRENNYQYAEMEYPGAISAAQASASDRVDFVRRVYAHLAGSVLLLIGLEALLLNTVDHMTVLQLMVGEWWSWLVVMALFMGAGFVARIWAQSQASVGLQYMGLGLYIVAWAIMFLPLIIIVQMVDKTGNVLGQSGIMTGAVFGGLTLSVFVMKKDYSFLAPVLCLGSLIALGVIVAAICFGFTLGLFFSFAMVALISGYILYDTSNVMLHYPTDMHVAAALELLADVAILFWYIVRIVMALNSRD
jgi:uncharacterized protein